MTVRLKKSGDEAAAAEVMMECFRAKYLVLCDGDERGMKKIAREEMKWRGGAGNMFVAEEDGRVGGIVEMITADNRTIPDHVFLDLYMKHLGLGAGLRGLYMLSALGRAVGADECSIAQLGVLPRYRRRGMARELLARAREYALEKELPRLTLWVDARNHPAISLYESEGFEVTEKKESKAAGRFFDIPEWLKMGKLV